MACSMASASEDDFLRVLEEMNRLCGEEEDVPTNNNNNEQEEDLKLATATAVMQAGPASSAMSATDGDPLDDIFAPSSSESGGGLSSTLSTAPLIGDQLLSSAASTSTSVPSKIGSSVADFRSNFPNGLHFIDHG